MAIALGSLGGMLEAYSETPKVVTLDFDDAALTNHVVVNGVAGRQIVILGMLFSASPGASGNARLQFKSAGTWMSGEFAFYTFGAPLALENERGLLVSVAGDSLTLRTVGSGAIQLRYVII